MTVYLNGKESNLANDLTLTDLINSKNLNRDRIIIQVDEEIIKKDNFDEHRIENNCRIEILSIVGGG